MRRMVLLVLAVMLVSPVVDAGSVALSQIATAGDFGGDWNGSTNGAVATTSAAQAETRIDNVAVADWNYEGCHDTQGEADRVAGSLRRRGYETKIKYDRVADCYEVWYR